MSHMIHVHNVKVNTGYKIMYYEMNVIKYVPVYYFASVSSVHSFPWALLKGILHGYIASLTYMYTVHVHTKLYTCIYMYSKHTSLVQMYLILRVIYGAQFYCIRAAQRVLHFSASFIW